MSLTPVPDPTATHISSQRTLVAVRLFWFFAAANSLLAWLLSVLLFYAYVGELPPETAANLAALGIAPGAYFWGVVLFMGLNFAIFFVVATLLFWRRSNDRIAALISVFFLGFGAANAVPPAAYFLIFDHAGDFIRTLFAVTFTTASLMGWPLIGFFLALFPDGRFVPHWVRYAAAAGFVFGFAWSLFPESFTYPQGAMTVIMPVGLLVMYGSGLYAQIYRYRRVSTRLQRQQTKWFIYGFVIVTIIVMVFNMLAVLDPTLLEQGTSHSLAVELLWVLSVFSLSLLPLSIGFAVMRYRLWDIDLLINRSLVYGAVILLLVALFGAIFFVLQALLAALLGQEQAALSGAVAAVVVLSLFNPARKRIRHFVDRRLYGFNFDLDQLAQAQKLPDIKNAGALTGQTLGGYQLLGVLGKGGMGEVYKGVNGSQTAAIKILPGEMAQQEEMRKRFEREAQALATISHPNIVQTFSSGHEQGVSYLVMEHIEGHTLSDLIRQRGPFSPESACRLIGELAAALDYTHSQGLVHRDIKPSNVMVRGEGEEPGQAVLMDFGIAKIRDLHSGITGTGMIGTIDYMAPEQIMAARQVDHRADIYALGVLLYELLTGERPFSGGAAQVMFAHLQQPPPDPRERTADLPRAVARAVLKAMAKDPQERFASAGELAAALEL